MNDLGAGMRNDMLAEVMESIGKAEDMLCEVLGREVCADTNGDRAELLKEMIKALQRISTGIEGMIEVEQ